MNRFYALGLVSAVLIPLLLPHDAEERSQSVSNADAPPRLETSVTVTRLEAPASLAEALSHASIRLVDDFDERGRCLAQAVYFEARSEPLQGQLAVAQVVLNRVRSTLWPNEICAVVFQNEHRRHGCQFSFACDGLSDNPHNPRAWRNAKLVAAVALYGLWQDITEAATHYHADYVAPAWRTAMNPTVRYGRHQFYRDARQTVVLNASLGEQGS